MISLDPTLVVKKDDRAVGQSVNMADRSRATVVGGSVGSVASVWGFGSPLQQRTKCLMAVKEKAGANVQLLERTDEQSFSNLFLTNSRRRIR